MSSKSQIFISIATTLTFGLYGIISAVYSELQKDRVLQSEWTIAFCTVFGIVAAAFTFHFFIQVYLKKDEDRASTG